MRFIQLHTKIGFILFFLIVFQSNSFGQDFEWVYNTLKTNSANDLGGYSSISDLLIDDQDNMYIAIDCDGLQDFSNGAGSLVFDTGLLHSFIVKLDKNKNIIWFRRFNFNVNTSAMRLYLDANQNLLITVYTYNIFGSSYIDLNPDPGQQETLIDPTIPTPTNYNSSAIIKLNSDGNYLNGKYYQNSSFGRLLFDSNQNIIAGVSERIQNFPMLAIHKAKVLKLDENLNEIWVNELDAPASTISKLTIESNDDIILIGRYTNFINFGGENYQNDSSLFKGKISSDGNEEWFLELPFFIYQNNPSIVNDKLYFSSGYDASSTFVFQNTTIANLPFEEGNGHPVVIFTTDLDENYISHLTLSGLNDTYVADIFSFTVNEFDEFIITSKTNDRLSIKNSDNEEIASIISDEKTILLKMSASLELINYIELDHDVRELQVDSENNIIMYGRFRWIVDFDPHAINEYIIESNGREKLFLLKLNYCEAFPPTGDDLIFCSGENPTVADLKANEYNVSWYASLNSTVKLENNIPLEDGQTYYAEKNEERNCPQVVGRLAVLVTIIPNPPPPTLASIQPCYTSNLRLEDVNVEGTNIAFYETLTTKVKLSTTTAVDPNATYYMSQTVSGCESERVPFNIPAQSSVAVTDYTLNLCDSDRNNFEQLNLSNYISFLLDGNPNDYNISYHNSLVDAENGSNPIQNFEAFQANAQNIYVRFLYNDYSCYQIATLTISLIFPPEITEIITKDGTVANNSITVLPANPQYLYSIDGIHYQTSNVFENVLAGEYLVYVKDVLEACAEVTEQVYLLTYPRFFTPNGDGYNDFWKIKYAQFQFAVDVEIYDRYGNLLTSFDKNSPGWDGKYNGENLPSTDYWFKVTRFLDKKVIHKGHFSLKR
ncbi:gliding motility-associated-like protein [Flavobacterium arsenatis]|uniref:Gliding motility-associated-like protein n=1 Tax=Flavobacterium arsenatis TaxID=1484332 RepID=A0ABU1TRF3_9FLAO|nr:T9SS type B sorting domain-containing protein [Flavobacterium arsenatis]MDR6968437.1 gliding motility-associated-like protein [Flavobacterium arsenatis]